MQENNSNQNNSSSPAQENSTSNVWGQQSLISDRENRMPFEIALMLFRQWWGRNRQLFLNKSIPFPELYDKYSNDVKGQLTIPKNSFRKSWVNMCKKAGYYFNVTRVKGIMQYHTYEDNLTAKK